MPNSTATLRNIRRVSVSRGWSQAPFAGTQPQDKGQRAQTGTREVSSEHEKEHLYLEMTEHWNRLPREMVEDLLRRYLKPTWTYSREPPRGLD